MKKIFAILLMAGLFSSATQSFAQDTSKTKKVKLKKAVTSTTTTVPATTTTNATTVKTNVTNAKTTTTAAQTTATTKVTDKVVSTDAKGRTIYQGPKGGQYYINSSGKKEYIKKTN